MVTASAGGGGDDPGNGASTMLTFSPDPRKINNSTDPDLISVVSSKCPVKVSRRANTGHRTETAQQGTLPASMFVGFAGAEHRELSEEGRRSRASSTGSKSSTSDDGDHCTEQFRMWKKGYTDNYLSLIHI